MMWRESFTELLRIFVDLFIAPILNPLTDFLRAANIDRQCTLSALNCNILLHVSIAVSFADNGMNSWEERERRLFKFTEVTLPEYRHTGSVIRVDGEGHWNAG